MGLRGLNERGGILGVEYLVKFDPCDSLCKIGSEFYGG